MFYVTGFFSKNEFLGLSQPSSSLKYTYHFLHSFYIEMKFLGLFLKAQELNFDEIFVIVNLFEFSEKKRDLLLCGRSQYNQVDIALYEWILIYQEISITAKPEFDEKEIRLLNK